MPGTSTGTKRQAQVALAKLVTEVETGQVAKSHAGSVADLLDRWLDDITPTRTAYTTREHRRSVERGIKPVIGAVHLDRLSARDLDQLYRDLFERGLSPASVRRHHSILHAALDRAVKWGLVASNPADRATPPGTSRSTVTAPSVKEVGIALVDDLYLLSRSPAGSVPCLADDVTAGYARLAKGLGTPGHFHGLGHLAATVAIGCRRARAARTSGTGIGAFLV